MMTDQDRRRTRTNHQIDLSQLYGQGSTVTSVLRRRSEQPGEKGKLKSVTTDKGEWSPQLYDAAGVRDPAFALVSEPAHLPGDWPIEKRASLFAFGGERANSTAYTAAINTLFLREHNRVCTLLERNNPDWDDERVFQTARNINIVLLIKLVVEEYINHISPYWMRLLADPTPAYTARWNRENWIPVEFNLLYRWHSLVPTSAIWGEASVGVAELRFDNRMLLQDGLVAAFASASQTRAWRIGLFNTAAMLDLVEVASIQQGRDNRLARYNDYRELMQYPRVTRFEERGGCDVANHPAAHSGTGFRGRRRGWTGCLDRRAGLGQRQCGIHVRRKPCAVHHRSRRQPTPQTGDDEFRPGCLGRRELPRSMARAGGCGRAAQRRDTRHHRSERWRG